LSALTPLALLGGVLVLASTATAGSVHRVDGDVTEWAALSPIATDPAGDANDNFDVTTLYADSEGSTLFLQFDTTVVSNLPAGSASDGDLIIEIGLPGGSTLSLDFRGRSASLSGGGSFNWPDIGFTTAPTFAANLYEARVDLSSFGVGVGDQLTLDFAGSDTLSGGPVNFTMTGPALTDARRTAANDAMTTFRIASLNTKSDGLLSGGSRQSQFGRLIDAVDAEVYCFQEEWNDSASGIASFINSIDPLGDGANWSAHKVNGTIVVARGSITPLSELNNRYSAAIVEPIGGMPVLVISAHLKCCGFIGSTEDNTRIGQANDIVSTIDSLRNAGPGSSLEPFKDAPVIVVGDYNLVGSVTPEAIIENDAIPSMARWLLPHQIGESIVTWQSPTSSFWPGTLDVLIHTDTDLQRRNGFILNSADLNGSELAALGLNSGDSQATDHFMLVADFAAPAAGLLGDINGDCIVDTADLGILISAFLAPGGASDLNGDGTVDTADLGLLIGAFGSACP